MNKVWLAGNLGRDPEGRSVGTGGYVVSTTLATSRRWKDRDGNKQEETEWHNLSIWGPLGEVFEQYLHKGSKVAVVGRIKTRSWEDKDSGEKKYRTEIIVEEMEMLGDGGGGGDRDDDRSRGRDRGRRDRNRDQSRSGNRSGRTRGRSRDDDDDRPRNRKDEEDEVEDNDDDIPF